MHFTYIANPLKYWIVSALNAADGLQIEIFAVNIYAISYFCKP
jgi:hypothetical protein